MDETILKDSVTEDEYAESLEYQDDYYEGSVFSEETKVVIDVGANGKTMKDEYKEKLDFLDEQIASIVKEKRRLMVTCGVIFVLCVICLAARILAWGVGDEKKL